MLKENEGGESEERRDLKRVLLWGSIFAKTLNHEYKSATSTFVRHGYFIYKHLLYEQQERYAQRQVTADVIRWSKSCAYYPDASKGLQRRTAI